jgi:hypothetical protein
MGNMQGGVDEPFEIWETPASRLRRDAWRGDTHPEPAMQGPTPVPGFAGSAHAGQQLVVNPGVQLTQLLGLSSLFAELNSLRREVHELRQHKASSESQRPPWQAVFEEMSADRVREHVSRGQFAATIASRLALRGKTVAVTVEEPTHGESLSRYVIYVNVDESADANEIIDTEKRFYQALRTTLPEDLTPIADVVLRFTSVA